MGKRYLALIIAALLLMPCAFAVSNITVSLSTPADSATETSSSVAFSCSAVDGGGNTINGMSLYIDSVQNQTSLTSPLSPTVTGLSSGSHSWYCESTNDIAETNQSEIRSFTVSVASLIFSGTIPDISFPEDTTLSNNITLSNYFSDSPTYSITGSTNVLPSISLGVVSFSATGNWSGTETLRVTATAGAFTNYSNYFTVTVTAVNDAPYYTTIPAQNMTKNTNKTITLSSYFADVDNSTLNYSVSTAPAHMNYTISGATVTLAPEPNWTGTTSITFSASDGSLSATSNSVSLVVNGTSTNTSANRPPSLGCPLGILKLAAGDSKTYTITKSDPDGNTMTVEWKIDNVVVEGETGDSYEFSKDDSGTYVLKAVVSDGTANAECTWTIEVTSSADANYTSETADVDSIINDQKAAVARCGDGDIQEGENCANCPADVICKEGETCDKGLCAAKTSSSKVLMIIGIIIVVILGGGFAAYKFTTKKDATTRIRDGRNLSNVEREMPSVDLHDIYTKESPKADTGSIPQPQENPLKGYVHAMREKGVSDSDIEQALKEKGWNIALIKQALKH